jgi:hypothetical protein
MGSFSCVLAVAGLEAATALPVSCSIDLVRLNETDKKGAYIVG